MGLWDEITPRQREVAELLCQGLKYKEMAKRLGIDPRTVKQHLWCMYKAAGIKGSHLHKHILLATALTYERHPELRLSDKAPSLGNTGESPNVGTVPNHHPST